MPGETMPPEPMAEGNDVPVQEPGPASPAEPSQLAVPAPGAAPADTGQPAGFPDPEASALPGPPGASLDPAAVTGPPWPRLVAAAGSYTPPRLARWPIVAGILLFAGWIAALVAVPAAVSSSSSGYALTSTDAHFTATFPARPDRATNAVGPTTIIVYTAARPDHGVGVTYVALPASASFSFDGAVNGAASSQPGGKVISRNSLTYLGQPAEDAAIKFPEGFSRIRVVRFGSSVYVLEGVGPSASTFEHDYNVLLDTFRPL